MKDTSLLTAACRAKFFEKHNHGDFFAAKIVGAQIDLFDPVLAKFPPGSVDLFTYRMAWTDEQLNDFRYTQVVLLGAGMDSYHARRTNKHAKVFEVDLASTQEGKKARVKGVYDDSEVVYVSCDFETEDFMTRLIEAGLNVGAPTAFVWMGVTYYLTREAVGATLRRIFEECDKPIVLFDYAVDVRPDAVMATAEGELAKMKEPIQTKFADITPFLCEHIKPHHITDVGALSYIASKGGEVFPNDKRLLRFVSVS
jgi:methyltransferase (TIGR00027 family)